VRPSVTGKDLLDLGYPPGPEFKRIFDEVLERKFTGELKTKAAEMSFVLSHFPKKAGGNA
jgi:tRNA nucleotidyltransferase (CCA-adding enzyme)